MCIVDSIQLCVNKKHIQGTGAIEGSEPRERYKSPMIAQSAEKERKRKKDCNSERADGTKAKNFANKERL